MYTFWGGVQHKRKHKIFYKKIENILTLPPKQYIINEKLEKAANMLATQPDMILSEIAELCGFCDVYYFSRLFKKHVGMTPTEYKNSFI